jgi:hypothetical protein
VVAVDAVIIGIWCCNAMANYLHDDDEGKQAAQIKRIKRRKQAAQR